MLRKLVTGIPLTARAPHAAPPATTSVETQGPTIQDAIQKALLRLHATRSQVRVKVLSEGQPGLFGMRGKKPATVRVMLLKHK